MSVCWFDLDGDIGGVLVTQPLQSADSRFAGLDPDDVPMVNRDDDRVAAIVVTPTVVGVDESGSQATVSVRLSTKPSDALTIDLTNPDPGEISLDRSSVRFEPSDWETPRSFVISGVDDTEVDGAVAVVVVLARPQTSDARYSAIDPADVQVSNADNDALPAGAVLLDVVDLTASESGDAARIGVRLNRAPATPVRVALATDDGGLELQLPLAELLFDASNATATQWLDLVGVDDDFDDGDQPVQLTLSMVAGSDPDFVDLAIPAQTLTNLDDDQAQLVLERVGPSRIVEGQGSELRLRLAARPRASTRIGFTAVLPPGSARVVRVEPEEITIDPTQWPAPWVVVLRSEENHRADPLEVVSVEGAVVASDDAAFVGLVCNAEPVEIEDALGPLPPPVPVPIDRRALWWLAGLMIAWAGWRTRAERRQLARTAAQTPAPCAGRCQESHRVQ